MKRPDTMSTNHQKTSWVSHYVSTAKCQQDDMFDKNKFNKVLPKLLNFTTLLSDLYISSITTKTLTAIASHNLPKIDTQVHTFSCWAITANELTAEKHQELKLSYCKGGIRSEKRLKEIA